MKAESLPMVEQMTQVQQFLECWEAAFKTMEKAYATGSPELFARIAREELEKVLATDFAIATEGASQDA